MQLSGNSPSSKNFYFCDVSADLEITSVEDAASKEDQLQIGSDYRGKIDPTELVSAKLEVVMAVGNKIHHGCSFLFNSGLKLRFRSSDKNKIGQLFYRVRGYHASIDIKTSLQKRVAFRCGHSLPQPLLDLLSKNYMLDLLQEPEGGANPKPYPFLGVSFNPQVVSPLRKTSNIGQRIIMTDRVAMEYGLSLPVLLSFNLQSPHGPLP